MVKPFARVALLCGVLAGVAAASLMSASTASAHAIAELNGDPAYAGRTSIFTLELQHGCLSNEKGTDTVVAFFDSSFPSVRPKSVSGWKSQKSRQSNGNHKIKWSLVGNRPAFNTPTYFPLSIDWPKAPGVYGVPVKQKCDGAKNMWNTPDAPATANAPSPPLYPLPQIKVLPAP